MVGLPYIYLPPLGGVLAAGFTWLLWRIPLRLQAPSSWGVRAAILLAVAFCGVYSWFDVLHYEAANSHVTDLAQIDQRVWATLHGQFMHTTLQGQGIDNFLAFHVEPILALLSPLYLVVPSPAALHVVEVLGLGVSAVPLALWARKRLDKGAAAFLLALAFLLSPVLANNNDLLLVQMPLCVPCLSFAFYFQLQRRWMPFVICLLLALSVREEIAFVAIGMGLYALTVQRQRAGWAIVVGGAVWGFLCLGVVIPHFNQGRGFYWGGAYSYLGSANTPLEIAWNALTHPLLLVQHMVTPPRPIWVLSLLAPLGFLPILGWRTAWLALPTLGYLLLGEGYYDPNSWYPDPMLPFLYFGAIEAIAWLRPLVPVSVAGAYLVGAAVVSFRFSGVGPGTLAYTPASYIVTPQARAAEAVAASIPRELGVSATPQIIAHLSQRMTVSIFPELLIPHDVFLIDFLGWRGWHGYPAMYNEYDQALRRVLGDPSYGDFYYGDGLLLVKRDEFPTAAEHPMSIRLGDKVEFLGFDTPGDARAGQPLTVRLHWRALVQLDQAYSVSLQLGEEANGKVAQQDGWPWDGYFPTLEWTAGREIVDPHTVRLPSAAVPGEYRLFVSMYSLENGQAKPLTTTDGMSGVDLGSVTVEPQAR